MFVCSAPRQTRQEIWRLSRCAIHQATRQGTRLLHWVTASPHGFPARRGSRVLDAVAPKRSSSCLTVPSSAGPSCRRALGAEGEFVRLAVCLNKVHAGARRWTVLPDSFGVEGYNVFSWRRFHMPRFEWNQWKKFLRERRSTSSPACKILPERRRVNAGKS